MEHEFGKFKQCRSERRARYFFARCRTRVTQSLSVKMVRVVAATGDSFQPSISDDGRYVVYHSQARDLVPNTPRIIRQSIYYMIVSTMKTILVSQGPNGEVSRWRQFSIADCGDGKTLAYYSRASNLVTADINGIADLSSSNTNPDEHTECQRPDCFG